MVELLFGELLRLGCVCTNLSLFSISQNIFLVRVYINIHSDYFFDRLVRDLPVPIPGDGSQLVSLTNSEDVASLLCAPLSQPQAAVEQRIFNCGTSQLISFNDLVEACAKIAGKQDAYQIEHYDGDALGKGNFPFRLTNFYVSPDMAMAKLGWSGPSHNLQEDLVGYYQDYLARGGPTKELKNLEKDREILQQVRYR